jgi:hypothetical protein
VRRALLTAALVCLGPFVAAPAFAKTFTMGPQDPSSEQAAAGCFNPNCFRTWFQFAQPTPGIHVTAPDDGTIISWQVHGKTVGAGRLRLRVIRPIASGGYKGAGASGPAIASQGDGSPPRPVSLPIRQGDYIGVDLISPGASDEANVWFSQPGLPSTAWRWENGLAEGTTSNPDVSEDNLRLQVGVVVEEAPPEVRTLTPASGPPAGGQTVVIGGDHLRDATQVLFGSARARITSNSNSRIEAIAPPHAAGTVDVIVTTDAGNSRTSAGSRYTYRAPGAPPDRRRPRLTAFRVLPPTFEAADSGPSLVTLAAVGTRVRYRLSEPATTNMRIQRRRRGVRRRGRCVRARARRGRKRCFRWVRVKGRLRHRGAPGLNAFGFTGRLRGKALKPGRYRFVAFARDDAGNRSRTVRRRFRIKR